MALIGVAYIAYGDKAEQEMKTSLNTLKQYHDWPVCQMRGVLPGEPETDKAKSRWAKVNLLDWTPFDRTLYLDADTRVRGDLSAGFQALADGWDMAIAPSGNQGSDWLWHISDDERTLTQEQCGESLQLQAGVFFVAKNERTQRLFDAWANEWQGDEDQGALLRALYKNPVKTFMLGYPWNGGALVNHLCGRCRR